MFDWDSESAPARAWAVQDRIPLRQPTLFSGEGAIGKTLVALQLAVAHAAGRDWLGTLPKPGPAIYFGAEDEADRDGVVKATRLFERLHNCSRSSPRPIP
jgi:RecA-family ATPase